MDVRYTKKVRALGCTNRDSLRPFCAENRARATFLGASSGGFRLTVGGVEKRGLSQGVLLKEPLGGGVLGAVELGHVHGDAIVLGRDPALERVEVTLERVQLLRRWI